MPGPRAEPGRPTMEHGAPAESQAPRHDHFVAGEHNRRSWQIMQRADGSETMRAWERFLERRFRRHGAWCQCRRRLLAAEPEARHQPVRPRGAAGGRGRRAWSFSAQRHADLLGAASEVFARSAGFFGDSRSLMLLTNAEGIVLDTIGDHQTLDDGQDIHLMPGGDWREHTVGTNGIGTALGDRRGRRRFMRRSISARASRAGPAPRRRSMSPARGGCSAWSISPARPATYQRNNLSLAVATAQQIEMVLSNRMSLERMQLLEACLESIAGGDRAGLVVLDRHGCLVHSSGRAPRPGGPWPSAAGARRRGGDRRLAGAAAATAAGGLVQRHPPGGTDDRRGADDTACEPDARVPHGAGGDGAGSLRAPSSGAARAWAGWSNGRGAWSASGCRF